MSSGIKKKECREGEEERRKEESKKKSANFCMSGWSGRWTRGGKVCTNYEIVSRNIKTRLAVLLGGEHARNSHCTGK